MSFKTVYQLDYQGLFLCETVAQESPLEPGVFLLPSGCVETAPPKCKAGYMPAYDYNTDKWVKVKVVSKVDEDLSSGLSDSEAERLWRNNELARADIELNKSADGDGVGTVEAWRSYRKDLRAYPSQEFFPDKTKRPRAPDGLL